MANITSSCIFSRKNRPGFLFIKNYFMFFFSFLNFFENLSCNSSSNLSWNSTINFTHQVFSRISSTSFFRNSSRNIFGIFLYIPPETLPFNFILPELFHEFPQKSSPVVPPHISLGISP